MSRYDWRYWVNAASGASAASTPSVLRRLASPAAARSRANGDPFTPRRRNRSALALLALLTALAACGESSNSAKPEAPASTPAQTITRGAYIEQADAICRNRDKDDKATERYFVSAYDAGRFNDAAKALRDVADQGRTSLHARRALKRPAGDREALEAYYDDVSQQVGITSAAADAIAGEDTARVNALLEEVGLLAERVKGAARTYGFKVCGKG